MSIANAQDINDALRYSNDNIKGTARFRAMSGAFGALGGDISSLQINPAASAVFLNSSASLTIGADRIYNEAIYNGIQQDESEKNLNFNQIGAVFVFNNTASGPINKVTFGMAYDQTADNADQFFVSGQSNNSIDQYFLTEAQGLPLDLLTVQNNESVSGLYRYLGQNESYSAQQAFLGFESLIIESDNPDDPNSTAYSSNVASGTFDQDFTYETTGLNGKFSFNGAMQINDKFFLGANISTHFISFDRFTNFREQNQNTGSFINDISFSNKLSTTGAGISFQLGGIAKVSKMVRVGASYQSPTWYNINEETTQRVVTISDTDGRFVVAPDIINVYPEYELRTPGKATGSIALLFGKKGLLSFDYSYKDYNSIKFSSDNRVDYREQNNEISNMLQGASTARLGGEMRHHNWSFRGGMFLEQSPYKNDQILGERKGFSLGTGYNFGKIRLDVAYDYSEQEREEQFYPGSAFQNSAQINSYRNNITVSLNLKI